MPRRSTVSDPQGVRQGMKGIPMSAARRPATYMNSLYSLTSTRPSRAARWKFGAWPYSSRPM